MKTKEEILSEYKAKGFIPVNDLSRPNLIISLHRGPRIIILPNKKCYMRKGDCIGFKECSQCFKKVVDCNIPTPCKWIEI